MHTCGNYELWILCLTMKYSFIFHQTNEENQYNGSHKNLICVLRTIWYFLQYNNLNIITVIYRKPGTWCPMCLCFESSKGTISDPGLMLAAVK